MTGETEQSRNSGSQQAASDPVTGRIHNSQNPEVEAKSRGDISSIDQQEGNMNHGECGGHHQPTEKED